MVRRHDSGYHAQVFSSQATEPTMDFRLIARLLVSLLVAILLQACAGRDAAVRDDAPSGKSVHAGQQADVDFDERFSGEGELRTRRVTATAYNSLPGQTDSRPSEAAWGDTLEPGMKAIAVSSDLLAMGLTRNTRVRIKGLPGTYRVLDRMPSHWSNKIDIYMGTDRRKALQWGRQNVEISWYAD
jgi:3D (Asp-Asp-Asp) domain-containing protein